MFIGKVKSTNRSRNRFADDRYRGVEVLTRGVIRKDNGEDSANYGGYKDKGCDPSIPEKISERANGDRNRVYRGYDERDRDSSPGRKSRALPAFSKESRNILDDRNDEQNECEDLPCAVSCALKAGRAYIS